MGICFKVTGRGKDPGRLDETLVRVSLAGEEMGLVYYLVYYSGSIILVSSQQEKEEKVGIQNCVETKMKRKKKRGIFNGG